MTMQARCRFPRRGSWIAPLALCAALAAQGAVEQRVYHLGELVGYERRGREGKAYLTLPVRMPLTTATIDVDRDPDAVLTAFEAPRLGADDVLDLVQRVWGDREAGGPEPRTALRGTRLYLTAPAPVHAEVAQLIAALEVGLRQRYELTVHLLPPDAAVESHRAILDSAATDELLRQHPPTASHRSPINTDLSHLVRSGRMTSLLLDYDVEVAQESAIADPKVDKLFDGLRVGVLATQLADGRVSVQAGLRLSELTRPVRERTLEGKGLGNVHQPRMRSQILTGTGLLDDGGAMLLGGRSAGGHAFLLRIRRIVRPDPGDTGDVETIPIGFLLQPRLRLGKEPALRPPFRAGESWSDLEIESDSFDSGQVEELLDSMLDGRLADRAVRYDFVAHHLLLRGPAAARERVRAAVRTLAEGIRPVTLQYRVGTVPIERTQSFLQGRLTAGELAAMLATRGVIATVPGHDFRIVDGVETVSVRDYDVEIAQASAVVNPVMEALFAGVAFSGRLSRSHTGGLQCAGHFYYAAESTGALLESNVEEIGSLDATQTLFSEEELSVALTEPRAWQVLHMQPLRGADDAVVLMVRTQ